MDRSEKFGAEGSVALGLKEDLCISVDEEHLGTLLRTHLGLEAETGYTSLGRLRMTRADGSSPGA